MYTLIDIFLSQYHLGDIRVCCCDDCTSVRNVVEPMSICYIAIYSNCLDNTTNLSSLHFSLDFYQLLMEIIKWLTGLFGYHVM